MNESLDLYTVETQEELDIIIQKYIMITLDVMDISIKEIRSFPVKLVEKKEFLNHSKFQSYSDAYCNNNEIILLKGKSLISTIVSASHEYGHIIARTGQTRPIVVAEITAYNFQSDFLKTFSKIFKLDIKVINLPFFELFKISPAHAIASIFSYIPLGKITKQKYKREEKI